MVIKIYYYKDFKQGEGISRLFYWSFNTMLMLGWYRYTDLHVVVVG